MSPRGERPSDSWYQQPILTTVCMFLVIVWAAILTFVVATNYSRLEDAANKSSLKTSCLGSNKVRAEDIGLWVKLLPLVDQVAADPTAATTQRNEILALVNQTFAPQNCGS